MNLGSNQPLTEMSTRSISWGKGGWCVRLTTYHHPVSLSRNLGALNSWNPLGLSRPVMGLLLLHALLHDRQISSPTSLQNSPETNSLFTTIKTGCFYEESEQNVTRCSSSGATIAMRNI